MPPRSGSIVTFEVMVGLMLAACTSSTVSGAATPAMSSASSGSELSSTFNSCTALTDSDIVSYGLDPTTKADAAKLSEGTQVGCSWNNQQSSVSFILQTAPARAFLTNLFLYGVAPLSVGGRQAYIAPSPADGDCAIALQVGHNSAVVGVFLNFNTREAGGVDACVSNKAIAQKFETKLPK